MKSVELLAPAKNLETGIAAINSGADAIYIGAPNFGARQNAGNSIEDIEKLVFYAHKFYVKVHVTINTILNDSELKEAIKLINKLYEIGVDAIIIQDFGLLNAAAEGLLPPIQIHMSTQCDNRTLDKVKFFDSIGADRVILARELSLNQISDICKNVNCEIETFVHGALCVSYSGQCYMSYANGGRSANRGACAQPCRKKYSLLDEDNKVLLSNQYLLSLKDFNASESIEKLINCGVKSFKIEGRLKDVNYVKNVTLYYSNLISKFAPKASSGVVFTDFTPDLDKTFNRFYTDYFLNSRKNCYNFVSPKHLGEEIGTVSGVFNDYFTIKSKFSLNPQDGICFVCNGEVKGFLVNKIVGDKVYPNNHVELSKGTVLYRNSDSSFEKLLSNSKIKRRIGIIIKVYENKIYAEDEDGNMVSEAISSNTLPNNIQKQREIYKNQLSKVGNSDFYLKNLTFEDENLRFLQVSTINELRRSLLQKLMDKRIESYRKNVSNGISYAQFPYKKYNYRANVLNESAKNFYNKCGCDVTEYALESASFIPNGVELMRTKHCLRYALGLCSKHTNCNKKLFLADEKGKKYPLLFDCKNCEMVVLNQ